MRRREPLNSASLLINQDGHNITCDLSQRLGEGQELIGMFYIAPKQDEPRRFARTKKRRLSWAERDAF